MLSSLICLVGGAADSGGEGVGCGNYWDNGAKQVLPVQ